MSSEDLARRAVACKGWRWVPGMRISDGRDCFRLLALDEPGHGLDSREQPGALPDLDDPATIGCLLALVREAWGDAQVSLWGDDGFGEVELWAGVARLCSYDGDSLAEALVAALEAAP